MGRKDLVLELTPNRSADGREQADQRSERTVSGTWEVCDLEASAGNAGDVYWTSAGSASGVRTWFALAGLCVGAGYSCAQSPFHPHENLLLRVTGVYGQAT